MAKTLLDGTQIKSGSIPTTALSGGVVSSSAQATAWVVATASFATTASYAANSIATLPVGIISSSTQVNYTQLQNIPVGIVSSSSQINTGSFSGSFTGTLLSTASWASNSVSSSFATTASAATSITFIPPTASFATTSSFALNVVLPIGVVSSSTQVNYAELQNIPVGIISSSSQINTGSFSGSFTGVFIGTSSWASNAISSSFATTASYAPVPAGTVSSSQQISTGSFTGSFIGIHSGSTFGTASWATSASYVLPSGLPTGTVSSSTQINTGSFTGSFTGDIFGNTVSASTLYVNGNITQPSQSTTTASFNYLEIPATTTKVAFSTKGRILYSNYFADTASLPSATEYHGMFTHVHSQGGAYYSHGGNGWVKLWDQFNVPLLISASSQFTSSTAPFTGSFFGTGSGLVNVNADLLDGKDSTVFATTGSNIFIGNQTVTGSLFTSGSNALIGTTTLTGSLNVSGSTIQVGNNTLLGNTLLSGSLTVSGSLAAGTPNINFYGDTGFTGYAQFNPVTSNINTALSSSYIYVSGSTNDLYFSQNSNGYSNVTRLRWLEGNLYTGLLHGGLITTQSSTVYQVSSGSGIIVNLNTSTNASPYPTIKYLSWGNLTKNIGSLSASYDQQFIGIDDTNNIFAQGTPFFDGQYDTLIPLGLVLHQNHSTINGVKTQPSVAYGWKQRSNIFQQAFGALKLSGFTLAPSGSSTGSLVVGSGTAYADGANYTLDASNPSYVTDAGTLTSKIFRYYQTGSGWVYGTNGGAGYGAIDPTQYALDGVLTAVPGVGSNREWTNQRVYWFPNSTTKAIVVYYGNASYLTQADAIANIDIELFAEAPNTAANAIYLGYITVRNNADFTDAASFKISPSGLFRQIGGSGGGGSTISQVLSGLADVSITSPTDHQPLAYDTTAGKWTNQSNITANITGNATTATSASYATTASYAVSALSASWAPTQAVGSTSWDSLTGVPAGLVSSSLQFNSLTLPFTGSFTGSFVGTITSASYATSTPNTGRKILNSIPFIATTGQRLELQNIGAAVEEIDTGLRVKANLTNVDFIQVSARVERGTGSDSELVIQYSTDESTWNNLTTYSLNVGAVVDLFSAGTIITTEAAIASGAKTTVFLRLITQNGSGTLGAQVGNVILHTIYQL